MKARFDGKMSTEVTQPTCPTRNLSSRCCWSTSLRPPFDAAKDQDSYREKLDQLIAAKLQGMPSTERDAATKAPVVNNIDALQRSVWSTDEKTLIQKQS